MTETPITNALIASLADHWRGWQEDDDDSAPDSDGMLAGEALYGYLEMEKPPAGPSAEALERVLRAACDGLDWREMFWKYAAAVANAEGSYLLDAAEWSDAEREAIDREFAARLR